MNQRFLRLLIPIVCIMGLISLGVFLTPDETTDPDLRLSEEEFSPSSGFYSAENYQDSLLNPGSFYQPSQDNRPWLVWYWPGTDVNLPQAVKELTWIADQGFGGVEIQVTGKGIPVTERAGQFRDPQWIFLLRQISLKAQQFGLEIDWVIGPGIPSEHSRGQHGLTWGESHIRGDQTVSFRLPQPQKPLGHRLASILNKEEIQDENWISWQPDSSRLLGVWAGKPRSDQRSATFWTTTDVIQFDPDSTWSIIDWVKGDSLIKWNAPKGPWKIIALYETDLFTSPFHAVTSFRESVIDPYSGKDLSKGIKTHPALQAIPSDSLVGRAIRTQLQSPIADRLLPENTMPVYGSDTFETSIFPLLLAQPLVHHRGASAISLSRTAEYQLSTRDDAFQNHYEDWLVSQQLKAGIDSLTSTIHYAGYASKFVLNDWDRGWFDGASQIDIPGFDSHISNGNRTGASLVCDGAYFGGNKTVTAYIGQVPNMAFGNTPQLLKTQIDRAIFTGATEIAVHGKPYQHFTNSTEWDPATSHGLMNINHGGQYNASNPFHPWWPSLWNYAARLQYLSQLGRQQTDLLILYPFTAFPTMAVDSMFSLIQNPLPENIHWNRLSTLSQSLLERKPDSLISWLRAVKPFLQSLEEHGYSWSWMSEKGMTELADGKRSVSALYPELKALIIPERGSVRLTTANAIDRLHSEQDLPVFLLGADRPTARELIKPDSSNMMVAHLFRSFELPYPINTGAQLIQSLVSAKLTPDLAFTSPSPSIRQRSQVMKDGSRLFWLLNLSETPGAVSIVFGDQQGLILDPETGFAERFQPNPGGVTTINLSQYENKIIWLENSVQWPDSILRPPSWSKTPWLGQLPGATFEPLDTWEWTVDYPKETPQIMALPDTGLWDWREDGVLKFYHGEVSYTLDLKFEKQELEKEIILDLGVVYDAVEVQVNTHSLPIISWAPFRYQISEYLHPGMNTLQIWVTNARRNEKIGAFILGETTTTWSKGEESELKPAGMLGPVQLWRIPRPREQEVPEM